MNQVLIVEDNMDLRHCYMQVVNLCGCSAIPAENGQQALELLRRPSFHPKLVILDLMMPVMDGWTFLSERAKDPALNKVPVVVCSAAADRLPEGIRFMRKPISVDMLLSPHLSDAIFGIFASGN